MQEKTFLNEIVQIDALNCFKKLLQWIIVYMLDANNMQIARKFKQEFGIITQFLNFT